MSGSFLGRGKSGDRWSAHFQDELEKLARLPPGSDTWSPHRPKPDVLDTARQIGEDAGRCGRFVSIVSATSEGGIQLKWQDPVKELSLLVYPDQTVEYLLVR